MSLYKEAKASFQSLIQQSALVFVGFVIMLLLTRGNPSALIVGLSFSLGVGFVVWIEAGRLEKLTDSPQTDEIALELQTLKNFPSTDAVKENDNYKESLIKEIITQGKIDLNLQGADLIGANLRSADLSGVNLIGANLRSADLSGAYMIRVNLSRANLTMAYLNRAILIGTDLRGADLRGADLREAILSRSDLSRTDMSEANVENAHFGDNIGISESIKQDLIARGAIFDDSLGSGDLSKISLR